MTTFNRGTGLLIIEVQNSNPNGDPDAESEPRTLDGDGRGLISPVSFKRKLRDLVGDEEGPVWTAARNAVPLPNSRAFKILETRGRKLDEIAKLEATAFKNTYWDARIFGNTTLESMQKAGKVKGADKEHFINTGTVQFGPGISISPVEVVRLTMTNKAGVESDKDRGMAPLAWRVVRHAVYVMPFFVNPTAAGKSGCDATDIELLKFLIPHAYRHTASVARPFVEVRHAWYAEHKSPLGSCPDSQIIEALVPRRTDPSKGDQPSANISDYVIPVELPDPVLSRIRTLEDLCTKDWAQMTPKAA
jgi:Cas7 group CRISPR-associated protein Csh2